MRVTPKIFALADGRTERVFHKQNEFQNTLKENKFCTMVDALKKKQTITSTALRLGTVRMVFFSGSFSPYSWNGQWNNRTLGSFDMSSPLETLVHETITTADKNTSQVEICTVCEYKHYPLRVRSQGFDEAKYRLRGWIYCCHCTTQAMPFITAAATKISRSYSKQLAGNLPSSTVKFPTASKPYEGTRFEVSL